MPNLRNFILMTNVAWALASALAQTATPPSIDPALLTKEVVEDRRVGLGHVRESVAVVQATHRR